MGKVKTELWNSIIFINLITIFYYVSHVGCEPANDRNMTILFKFCFQYQNEVRIKVARLQGLSNLPSNFMMVMMMHDANFYQTQGCYSRILLLRSSQQILECRILNCKKCKILSICTLFMTSKNSIISSYLAIQKFALQIR